MSLVSAFGPYVAGVFIQCARDIWLWVARALQEALMVGGQNDLHLALYIHTHLYFYHCALAHFEMMAWMYMFVRMCFLV